MPRKMTVALAAGLFMLATLPGRAETIEGVTIPDIFTLDGRPMHLNGAGLRAVPIVGIDIYIAALYLATPSHDPQAILARPEPKVVVLWFLHGASKEQVEGQFRRGEQINCGQGKCNPADQPDFEKLVAATPAIARGDTATYIYYPNRLVVLSNGKPNGEYMNGDLSRELLAGFLGDHPPTERLKRQMLGVAD